MIVLLEELQRRNKRDSKIKFKFIKNAPKNITFWQRPRALRDQHPKSQISDLRRFCPPPPLQYVVHPPVREHVPLHSKSLCKNMAVRLRDANNLRPLSWGVGAQTEKIPNFNRIIAFWKLVTQLGPTFHVSCTFSVMERSYAHNFIPRNL